MGEGNFGVKVERRDLVIGQVLVSPVIKEIGVVELVVEVVRKSFCIGPNGGAVESRGLVQEPTIQERLQKIYAGDDQQVVVNTFQRQVRICVSQASGTVTSDYDVPDYVVAAKIAAEEGKMVPRAKKRNQNGRSRTGKNFGQ